MKPAPFGYRRPGSLAEALTAYADASDAKILAGGQSLIPLLSMRLASVAELIDINGIEELSRITVSEDGVRFGATVRHSDLLAHEQVAAVQPMIPAALHLVAHATIRNRGTTVGSIVHADASAEMPVVLRLLGGTVTAASGSGTRTIPADELYVGPLETSLRPDEIATEAWFPALGADAGVAFDEVARRHGDYALCGVAALVAGDGDGRTTVRAGYLSVCEVPTVVDLTAVFDGDAPTEAELDGAADLATDQLEPEADIHASADYRRHLARVLTRKVVRLAFEDRTSRRTGGPA